MADEFKKFIDTGGKTLDEIRRTIEKMLNNAADTVVDEAARIVSDEIRKQIDRAAKSPRRDGEGFYRAEKIPPRREAPKRTPAQPAAFFSTETRPDRTAYPHEHVDPNMSERDEYMLDKIKEMRALEENCDRTYRRTELTLVKQGTFMADVEDDFSRRVFCALPEPFFAAMSNSQLRTYFTWRTDVRRGKFAAVDKPYVLLYCFEMLNMIGAENAADAFGKMLELWENCRGWAGYLDELMPRWLKDFYVYNDVTEKYPDITLCMNYPSNGMHNGVIEELENGDYSDKLDYLAEYSAYNIKGSIFFNEQTKPMLNGACEAALTALADYFKICGADILELVCGKPRKDHAWKPFRGAIVDMSRMEGFRPVKISSRERYCIKRGEPARELFDFSPSRGFIGYLLKSVEAELRRQVKFKRYITPNITMLLNDIKNRDKLMAAVSDEHFEKIIPSAVADYCRKNGISAPEKPRKSSKTYEERSEYVREKVEIDVTKLGAIREQSDELAKKLIVDEAEEYAPSPYTENYDERIEQISMDIADEDFDERVADCAELAPENDPDSELSAISSNPLFEELPEEWQSFANRLTPTLLTVLKLIPCGGAAEFCRENGFLPETLYEEINTEALDTVADIVIEGGEIIPDYAVEIGKIVEAANL